MDKLSEYIPVVIILVSLIFSFVGKKKKAGKVTQKTTLPGKTVKEFVEEREVPQVLINSYRKPAEEKPKKPVVHKPLPPISSEIVTLEPEEEKMNLSFSFEEEDDVMRAIVYAEIMNRKEW
ncbi:MAG: hypothetical protein FWF53_06520 [Candidatus Azobacteroides sp.]|nr:hypothetical protein [Candidatus Azobacteroides sp.]